MGRFAFEALVKVPKPSSSRGGMQRTPREVTSGTVVGLETTPTKVLSEAVGLKTTPRREARVEGGLSTTPQKVASQAVGVKTTPRRAASAAVGLRTVPHDKETCAVGLKTVPRRAASATPQPRSTQEGSDSMSSWSSSNTEARASPAVGVKTTPREVEENVHPRRHVDASPVGLKTTPQIVGRCAVGLNTTPCMEPSVAALSEKEGVTDDDKRNPPESHKSAGGLDTTPQTPPSAPVGMTSTSEHKVGDSGGPQTSPQAPSEMQSSGRTLRQQRDEQRRLLLAARLSPLRRRRGLRGFRCFGFFGDQRSPLMPAQG